MDSARRADLIAQYKDGYRVASEALAHLTDADLDRRPSPDAWTPREIAHHLADSETMSYLRLRRLLAEDRPMIQSYDEEEWARRLHYERPIAASLEVLSAVRAASASLLESLTEEEWAREGTHSESGAYSVTKWLEIYADHAHNHAEQILRARG